MATIDELFGDAVEVDAADLDDIQKFLLEEEGVEKGFVLLQTMLFFTDRRLLIVKREGFTGAKRDYHTIPYDTIRDFSVGTPGRFENEGELRLWLYGMTSPMRFTLNQNVGGIDIHNVLSRHVL